MKFTWFHHEIHWISWIVDFAVFFCKTNTDIHEYRYTVWSTTECCIFHQNQSPWHEIQQISWNLVDFMKSARFHGHEIRRIPCMKSAKFHHEICRISWYTTECCIFHQNQYRYTLWAYYMLNMQCISPCHEIHQISCMKSAEFHEIHQISWNPPDFICQMSQGPMVLFFRLSFKFSINQDS